MEERPHASALSNAATALDPNPSKSSTVVNRATPAIFSPSHLLVLDPNPLPSNTEPDLRSAARDAAQMLLSHLLTTCPVTKTSDGATLTLEPGEDASIAIPREKRLPAAKKQTPWEAFAAKKGIKKRRKGETGPQGRANKVFDEDTQEWQSKWGFGGKNKEQDSPWLVELKDGDGDQSNTKGKTRPREERRQDTRRHERRLKANARSRKGGLAR